MREYLNIGPSPIDEDCVQVGNPDYAKLARIECNRYIDTLRQHYGNEPEKAQLEVKSFPHDFGSYREVVCYYDTENKESIDYAFKVEGGVYTWPLKPAHKEKPLSLERITSAIESNHSGTCNLGFCKACGEEVDGCEPDARNYSCPTCNKNEVFGAEELLMEVM